MSKGSGTARVLSARLSTASAESHRAQSDSGVGAQVDEAHLCRLERATAICIARSFSNSFDQRGDRWPQGTPRRSTERTAIAGRFVLETEDPGLRDRPLERAASTTV